MILCYTIAFVHNGPIDLIVFGHTLNTRENNHTKAN